MGKYKNKKNMRSILTHAVETREDTARTILMKTRKL